ncbi:MAG: Holliday junction branch migration protein RuvA [Thermoanaerobaculia bacterium]|nr:Holliday junction branch migration protein RuvA [Thermoanaerobaculia bacterium]
MIGFLRGVLLESSPDHVLVDVNGVGYSVRVPFSTYCELDVSAREATVGLYIRTHVREDTLDLYGFLTQQEKRVFDELISVSGIGPRLAQGIMSGMGWEDLLGALAAGDAVRLTRIPGVGKKTAERMVVELRDKANTALTEMEREPAAAVASPREDLVAALVNLGYRQGDAEKAAAQAVEEAADDAPLTELLRLGLKRLSRA